MKYKCNHDGKEIKRHSKRQDTDNQREENYCNGGAVGNFMEFSYRLPEKKERPDNGQSSNQGNPSDYCQRSCSVEYRHERPDAVFRSAQYPDNNVSDQAKKKPADKHRRNKYELIEYRAGFYEGIRQHGPDNAE